MVENVCKNCGAPLDVLSAVGGVVTCAFCGSAFTLPRKEASDKVKKYLDAGEIQLDLCRFDDALTAFGKAVEADGKEPEAYWGRALARNRVQYLHDTVNNRLQPVCHEVSEESFTSDPDYKRALTLATEEQRAEYAKKAEEIDYIRSEFYALERTGLKYDCFICVKVTEEDGGHTEDSFAALKLYNALKKAGYKPFFSEEEMGERTGADYEALILYALKSAGSLLIVCSDKRYLETKWVKNEYTRYAAMLTDEEKERGSMAIVYLGKPIEKLPGIKGKLQGVDYRQFDAMDRIRAFIDSHDEGKRRARAERDTTEQAEREAAEEAARARAEAAEKRAAEMERRLKELEAAQNVHKNAPKSDPKNATKSMPAKPAPKPATTPVKPAAPKPSKPAVTSLSSAFAIVDGVLVHYNGPGGDVVIPAGVKKIGTMDVEKVGVFWNRQDITSVTIPAGVTEIDYSAFKGCKGLKRIALPAGLKQIGVGAFEDCTALETVDIPDSVTELRGFAFMGCKNLTRVTLPAGLESIAHNLFSGCERLQSIVLPAGVKEIEGSAFNKCVSLVGIVWPQMLKSIGAWAFYKCKRLPAVILPDRLTEIGKSAFNGCTGFTEITIPDSVKVIGETVFSGCDKLKNVSLPGSVKKVGETAFGDGDTTVTVRGKKPLIKPIGWHRHWKGVRTKVVYTE